MRTMSATIEIDAPPAEVWQILTDLGSYREWNPLFVEASGSIAAGERISGEHSFVLSATATGTQVVQAETFQGLLSRFSGKTFANADASFRELNQALKERAEARTNRPADSAQ